MREVSVEQGPEGHLHRPPAGQGLYDPANEHDACGLGFIAHIKGQKSHAIVTQGLAILENLTHRGATGADSLQGDGAGILIQMPDGFLRKACGQRGMTLPAVGRYGVGMVFLPKEPASRMACEQEIERAIASEGQLLLGWRDVPTNNSGLSMRTREVEPVIRQVFIAAGANDMDQDALERKLYIIRKKSGHAIQALKLRHGKEFYVPSMSTRTLVYKGMLLAHQVGEYFLDLADESMVSALAMVHQRFSTNTFPTWDLAHPFRLICHNGEINTLRGNVNWIRARQHGIASSVLGADLDKIWPLIYDGQSDSASFDNALELLVMGGYPLAHAMMLMIPEAWAGNPLMDEDRRAFYEYHAALMEPWDGPAAMAFTDGRQIGATLDRNGLRPARYIVTDDDFVIMGSEVGVLDIPERKIVRKWRLQPGKMLLVDTEQGRIIDDEELKRTLATAKPYREWIDKSRVALDALPEPAPPQRSAVPLLDRQQAFGYTQEDVKHILLPMAQNAEEPTGSMGNDAALPVLSSRPKVIYGYFKQLFAQVTNPPIDPIREELVMSLVTFIGPRPNLLGIDATTPQMRLEAQQPVLTAEAMEKIRHVALFTGGAFKAYELDICYPAAWGGSGMEAALASLAAEAEDAVRLGYNILIVSDRRVSADTLPIPALLATAAVHQHLVRKGLRTSTGLVVETGSAREVHHFALLAGYGAEAIHPYLALETLEALTGTGGQGAPDDAAYKFIKAICKGLNKVMSKMGISTYQSYCGAQIFEAVGLQKEFVDKYFTGTASNVEGMGLFEIAEEAARIHGQAFGNAPLLRAALDPGGEYSYRVRGEDHMWTPDSIAKLQHATRSGSYSTYKEYAALINDQTQRMLTLRGLFEFRLAPAPVPLAEVEPATEIVKRFATGAMSLGSISTEAHTTLAIAMNRIGGKSNTGEGGEDARRYPPIAQGRDAEVPDSERRRRHSPEGRRFAALEDQAGRVGPLRRDRRVPRQRRPDPDQDGAGREARRGRPAARPQGVRVHRAAALLGAGRRAHLAAAAPRHLLDRGPGAADPRPQERQSEGVDLGQARLRGRRRHGGRGGRQGEGRPRDDRRARRRHRRLADLVDQARRHAVGAGPRRDAADAGAEPPARAHRRAGRRPDQDRPRRRHRRAARRRRVRLRDGAAGRRGLHHDAQVPSEHLPGRRRDAGSGAAQEVHRPARARRQLLLLRRRGSARADGEARRAPLRRADRPRRPARHAPRHRALEGEGARLQPHLPPAGHARRRRAPPVRDAGPRPRRRARPPADRRRAPAIESRQPVRLAFKIRNAHRSVGAMLSGAIAQRYGNAGLPDDTVHVAFQGIAGQSFGAFLARGVTFELQGATNDYVGKGQSGGRIVVYPDPTCPANPEQNIVIGNTVMYGAIAGESYFRGVAGERFCVRNSGASAVVEGTGDHGCEYMTGGTVVVLGRTGRNFAAGMSGGIAFVYDEDGAFRERCNTSMVALEPVLAEADQASRKASSSRRARAGCATRAAPTRPACASSSSSTCASPAARGRSRSSTTGRARGRSSSRCSRTSTGAR